MPVSRMNPLPAYLIPLLTLFPPATHNRIFLVGGTVRDICWRRQRGILISSQCSPLKQ